MTMQIYSVRDLAVEAYGPPIFVRARGEALRQFIDACKDKTTQFAKHPSDYEMYYLGTWDDVSGQLITTGEPERVARAVDFAEEQ